MIPKNHEVTVLTALICIAASEKHSSVRFLAILLSYEPGGLLLEVEAQQDHHGMIVASLDLF